MYKQQTNNMRITLIELICFFHLNIGLSSGIWANCYPGYIKLHRSNYNYSEAEELCASQGARLSTLEELQRAHARGAHACAPGWFIDKYIRFPLQYNTSCTSYSAPIATYFTWSRDLWRKFKAYCTHFIEMQVMTFENEYKGDKFAGEILMSPDVSNCIPFKNFSEYSQVLTKFYFPPYLSEVNCIRVTFNNLSCSADNIVVYTPSKGNSSYEKCELMDSRQGEDGETICEYSCTCDIKPCAVYMDVFHNDLISSICFVDICDEPCSEIDYKFNT